MTNIIKEVQNVNLEHNHFKNIRFSWILVGISVLLALFKTQFVPSQAIGLGNILFYMIALVPVIYLITIRQIVNRYTLLLLPFLLIWLVDSFIYNNSLAQDFLPYIIMGTITIMYLTSMQKVDFFYQTLIPRLLISFSLFSYFRAFTTHLFSFNKNYSTYKRVLIGIAITTPFVVLFLALFRNADTNFNFAVTHFMSFFSILKLDQVAMISIYFLIYLSLFLYSYLNYALRPAEENQKSFDMLIVGIFLGALNVLFVTFLVFQIAYLFGGEVYIRGSGISPAQFAREGFFQLAWVISLVVIIFLVMMRRYKGEVSIKILMSFLMFQTIIMGIAALKKMHLYQLFGGVTTLRYYVEWFEYFLIAVLVIGIVFIILRKSFHVILNTIVIMGLIAFSIVASLNIDYMIAAYNIEKFKYEPNKLDTAMLSNLSIDALPALIQIHMMVKVYFSKNSCHSSMQYHLGRCHIISQYGDTQFIYSLDSINQRNSINTVKQ